jgi:SNF2 family DNA or RNA helicase
LYVPKWRLSTDRFQTDSFEHFDSLKVSTTNPFQIIYSLFEHEYLGYLFESFVIQLDQYGKLTFKHQNISNKNAQEFADGLDETDFKLIKLCDSIQQDAIVKKFANSKKTTPTDFLIKTFHKEKGDELLQDTIRTYIEHQKNEILLLLQHKFVFEMGHDGEPTWKQLKIADHKATILFHFMRNEENTHYFPTIKYQGEKVDFQYKNAIIVCSQPAWLLVDNIIYHFKKDVDGNKLKPFLSKKFILIPKKMEQTYYEKFVTPLIASFDVYAKGFEIRSEEYSPVPVLTITELAEVKPSLSLFGDNEEEKADIADIKVMVKLEFQYGDFYFPSDTLAPSYVKMESSNDSFLFHKVKRDTDKEKKFLQFLRENQLEFKNGRLTQDRGFIFHWLSQRRAVLETDGYVIKQMLKDGKRYFVGESSISVEVKENNDWFDVYAIVRFGSFEIPFIKLRNYILKGKREFELPSGEVAIIPEEWFAQYSELFAFMEEKQENILLHKHHVALVNELHQQNLAKVTISQKLDRLRSFEEIEEYPLPVTLQGTLRPYQQAGYNWMRFLNSYNLGGCLADDMGLGKTVQTLSLLLSEKERGTSQATLLVMPTSLVYNWEVEARKFAPTLKLLNYTGIYREKNIARFQDYDLVITSYGTVRVDIELLKQYQFHYIILDESQVIKNPESNIAKSVKQLHSKHKLILTGTPIENSTLDLWSQMSFVNPGLLGTQAFFKNEFLNPIEKKHDELKVKRLYSIIKPFILRRIKSQVVKELPEKIENIKYCMMTPEQEKEYESVKSNYRNLILESIEDKGLAGSQILLLQGLTKLRQIANHPKLTEESYDGESGKMEDVKHLMENALTQDHKILVFSQFVKHLQIYAAYLEKKGIPFAYLDGSTKDRQAEVERFQQEEGVRIFLISLRAGGLGLNLTAADYVFLLDPWWNPAIEAQAVDRAYRIGQKNTVFTYKFITQNTVEEKILHLQQSKLKLANDLINSEESFVKSLSKEDIQSIFD